METHTFIHFLADFLEIHFDGNSHVHGHKRINKRLMQFYCFCFSHWNISWEDLFMFCSLKQNKTPLSFTPGALCTIVSRRLDALCYLIVVGRFAEHSGPCFLFMCSHIHGDLSKYPMGTDENTSCRCQMTMPQQCHVVSKKHCSLSSHWQDDGLYFQWSLTQCPCSNSPTAGKCKCPVLLSTVVFCLHSFTDDHAVLMLLGVQNMQLLCPSVYLSASLC